MAIGADSKVVNTGRNGVCIILILQWIICKLHLIELLIKALCVSCFGMIHSPNSFRSETGYKLWKCDIIPNLSHFPELTSELMSDLSLDHCEG